ncbi:PREDICTED: uncharacterized protein LOC106934128 isoform X1 [Poecilia mexicana]|uniref:uncharacterized protein LOC106934128 isoform X1 n=1 Tax=Poecilia mexicana TaxID=48701 RepID=UPI00072E304B|nr:PREDICTED: uncharacterized protein LOC106934128 isoform X1 [Poecilia mexicana]
MEGQVRTDGNQNQNLLNVTLNETLQEHSTFSAWFGFSDVAGLHSFTVGRLSCPLLQKNLSGKSWQEDMTWIRLRSQRSSWWESPGSSATRSTTPGPKRAMWLC